MFVDFSTFIPSTSNVPSKVTPTTFKPSVSEMMPTATESINKTFPIDINRLDISTSILSASNIPSKVTPTSFKPSVSEMMPTATEFINKTFPIDINLPNRLDVREIVAVAFTVMVIIIGVLFYKRNKYLKKAKKVNNDNNEPNIKNFLGIFTPQYGSFISIAWMIIWMLFSGCVMAFSKYSFTISEFRYYNEHVNVVIQFDDVLRWIGISTMLISIALWPGIFLIICKSSSLTIQKFVKIFIFEIFYFILSNVAFISVYEYAGIKCQEHCYNYYNLGIYVERFLVKMYENTYTDFNMPLWMIPLILGTFPSNHEAIKVLFCNSNLFKESNSSFELVIKPSGNEVYDNNENLQFHQLIK
ncbi:43815_t:CDS:2 [Gigaspora margarita]|uniref:43815_t:CDS:1 n=1 Tax=Gigaspora margarita TaxID=4874 RepID=A0ABM8VX03_GIGMA|nr:43815_t:CDS:2 [Gigaspora margarita]